jgi:hypothetical protein
MHGGRYLIVDMKENITANTARYQRKAYPVHAVQFLKEKLIREYNAYFGDEIFDCKMDDDEYLLFFTNSIIRVKHGDWIVRGLGGYATFTEEEFKEWYEVIPKGN